MKTKTLPFLETELPKGPKTASVPEWCPALPMLAMFAATRGSGKTTSIASMLRKMQKAGVCHRVFLMSPTYDSNIHLWKGLVNPDDVFEPVQSSLDEIVQRVEAEVAEFRLWKEMYDLWKKYKKTESDYINLRSDNVDPDVIGKAMQAGLTDLDKFPAYKYPGAERPLLFLVVDDCQSSPIFLQGTKHKNSLSSLCIRNRHIGGLEYGGLSIICALQNWKAQQGVMSRAIRMNLTCVAMAKYRDRDIIKDIYTEVANDISEEQFYAAYEYATRENKWDFLFVEFSNPIRLRKNFSEIIQLDSISAPESAEKIVDNLNTDGDSSSPQKEP